MTLQECYSNIGDFNEVMKRLPREAMVSKFVLRFLDDKNYDQLMKAIADGDYKTAFMASHTIKGVCQNLSFTKLLESSHLLTEALRSDTPDMTLINQLAGQVSSDYKMTTETIKAYKESL